MTYQLTYRWHDTTRALALPRASWHAAIRDYFALFSDVASGSYEILTEDGRTLDIPESVYQRARVRHWRALQSRVAV